MQNVSYLSSNPIRHAEILELRSVLMRLRIKVNK